MLASKERPTHLGREPGNNSAVLQYNYKGIRPWLSAVTFTFEDLTRPCRL